MRSGEVTRWRSQPSRPRHRRTFDDTLRIGTIQVIPVRSARRRQYYTITTWAALGGAGHVVQILVPFSPITRPRSRRCHSSGDTIRNRGDTILWPAGQPYVFHTGIRPPLDTPARARDGRLDLSVRSAGRSLILTDMTAGFDCDSG